MKEMESGHVIWQGEGVKRAWVWAMDNVKVDIKEYDAKASICLRTVKGSEL